MTKEHDYRRRAADSVELANHATTPVARARLLDLAAKWLALANRVHQLRNCI